MGGRANDCQVSCNSQLRSTWLHTSVDPIKGLRILHIFKWLGVNPKEACCGFSDELCNKHQPRLCPDEWYWCVGVVTVIRERSYHTHTVWHKEASPSMVDGINPLRLQLLCFCIGQELPVILHDEFKALWEVAPSACGVDNGLHT